MAKKSRSKKGADLEVEAVDAQSPAARPGAQEQNTKAKAKAKTRKKGEKSKSKEAKRKQGGEQQNGGDDDDRDEGYESPDIAEGLDELAELAELDLGQGPDAALKDLAALEIPDDDDEAGEGTAGAMSKQDRKAAAKLAKQEAQEAAKLAKQEAKQEAEREKQRQKQEAKEAAKLAKQEAKAAAAQAVEEQAAAEAAAADEAAIAEVREQYGIKEGHPVEYKSASKDAWVPAKLIQIRADGSLHIDLGNGRINDRCDPDRVRPALFRAKPKVLEAHLKDAKRSAKLESQAGAIVLAAEAERLLAAKSLLLRSCHNGDMKGMRSAMCDGAQVDCRDENRWTPLMCAARHGDARCVRALINAGANVNYSSRGGATALHMAASNGRIDAILELLKAGADHNATTDSGMRPRQLAERRGLLEAVATIDVFQEGGGLDRIQRSTSSLAQREALRDVVVQAKVRRRALAGYSNSMKRQKGEELLERFRNQIGPLHRQGKAQQDFLATRGEAHAQEVESRWYWEHSLDPRGLQAASVYLQLLEVHRLPNDKMEVAIKNVILLRKLFDALDTRRQGWLPRYVVYEFLKTMDTEWSPPGSINRDYYEDEEAHWITTFRTMLKLFIGSSSSVNAIERALLTDYNEIGGLALDVAAIIQIGQKHHGRSVVDYGEWTDTLMPALKARVKKSHQMKPKECLEVWRSLKKIPDNDPRIQKYKHGGLDVSGVEHADPSEPGHVDAATLLASIRPDGDGIRSIKNQKLYKKFYDGVLASCTEILDEVSTKLAAEQDTIVEGDWLRANRPVVVRADDTVNSAEVAILAPGETIQVLSMLRIPGTTMLRIQCVRGWVTHTSVISDEAVFERVNNEDRNSPPHPSFDHDDPLTTDEEIDEIESQTPNQAIKQDVNDTADSPECSKNPVGLLAGMLCVALEPLRARQNAEPKSKRVTGGSVPKGQAFHILSVSQNFPGYALCYCGWVRILVDGRPSVKFLDDTEEAAQVFVIGGAGRISDVGPLGITFIESPNPHWIPGSDEPKFCTTLHSVGRGSPAAKACPEMARGACYGWVLEYVEGVSVTRMTFDDVLTQIQQTSRRPMNLRLRPPCFISVPLKPILNEDGTDIAKAEEATEGQDEKGLGGCFFNSLMHGFYCTVHETTLRSGYEVGTRVAGVLAAGTFVEVIESRVNSMGHTRMLCISLGRDDSEEGKGTQGWASLYARDGRRLLREQTSHEVRDRDHLEHNAFLVEERLNAREETRKANKLQARKLAAENPLEIKLFAAVINGDASWVLKALEQGAHGDCIDPNGCTPIMRAAENGHVEVVQALWQYGIQHENQMQINQVSEDGTALGLASSNGHTQVVVRLLNIRADPLTADKNGVRAVDIARRMQNDQLLMRLEEATDQAKRDLARAHAKTSVQMAAMQTFGPNILRKIAEACDDLHEAVYSANVYNTTCAIRSLQSLDSTNGINRPDAKGNLPLSKAAAAGFCAIVSLLLANKATVDARNEGGSTALSVACSNGQVAATGLLLRAGADPNLALDSLATLANTVNMVNPLASGRVDGLVRTVTDAKPVAQLIAMDKAGFAGCQVLIRKAILAKNALKTNLMVGKKPTGVSPIDMSAWTGGSLAGAGMQIKRNGVPSPKLPENVAGWPDENLSVEGHVANDTAAVAQEQLAEFKNAKKRGLRPATAPDQPDDANAAPSVVGEVTEQTENPLASSYSTTGLASPIADGQTTFDVEEGGRAKDAGKGNRKKWTGGLKRRRKVAATGDVQPGDPIVASETPSPHDAIGRSPQPADADELAAIEIPTDDGIVIDDNSEIGDEI